MTKHEHYEARLSMRDKYWSERDTDEKICALYDEVMRMRYQLTNVTALLEDMLTHSHADGKVVGPINRVLHNREYYVPVALQFVPVALRDDKESR